MKIRKNKLYKIKGKSKYFKNKYGTYNPEILIEDEDVNVFGGGWGFQNGNPACLLYAIRNAREGLPSTGKVYYGKIEIDGKFALGELVHESELE